MPLGRPIDPTLRRACSICGTVYTPRAKARKLGTLYCSKACSNASRKRPLTERLFEQFDKRSTDECWPWTGCFDKDGYGLITDNNRVQRRAHRVMFELVNGAIPNDRHVMHACDNPACVNPRHLSLGTVDDNNKDKAKKLRASAKLTPDDVRQIRAMHARGVSVLKIAEHIGISYGSIYPLLHGKTWKHVT